MCVVEVEGMRGFPTACTTPVEDGMIVRTHTAQLQAIRTEILQLILSEHPCSCLVCEENEQCRESTNTIRKAGVTTGCRFCPNDGQCELQEVVSRLGVKEVGYPIYYRGLPVEKQDPFYDRDYNLCILCGRCIRICQEVRLANTLSFKQRGRQTVIGPAYSRTHLEAGCEFCGACVAVCPTGALFEKARKWEGKPTGEVTTTCALCSLGCQLRLLVKDDHIIGSLPAEKSSADSDQLCVVGRFCITELVNNYRRLKQAFKVRDGGRVPISFAEAIDTAAEKLQVCPPGEFVMMVSPNCSNEDLYVAQKFARVVMGSNNIEISAKRSYGANFASYYKLMGGATSLSELNNASLILCIGLDTRFAQSVVGVQIRKAIKRGAKLVTINPREHNLSLIADIWLRPSPGEEIDTLRLLASLIETDKTGPLSRQDILTANKNRDKISHAARLLGESDASQIIVGAEFSQYSQFRQILEAIEKLAKIAKAEIILLPSQGNLYGSLMMGAYAELLPGGAALIRENGSNRLTEVWGVQAVDAFLKQALMPANIIKKPKVLYLVGERLPDHFTGAEYIIAQNIYPPESSNDIDLLLPAAAFTETDGTFINREGRIQFIRKAVEPPGEAHPDWQILCLIAQKMGKEGLAFSNIEEIQTEISVFIDSYKSADAMANSVVSLTRDPRLFESQTEAQLTRKGNKKYPYLLTTSVDDNIYRGFPISKWVAGLRSLYQVGVVNLNPEDGRKLGISQRDEVVISSANFERTWPVTLTTGQLPGTLHVILAQDDSLGANPHHVTIRKKDV